MKTKNKYNNSIFCLVLIFLALTSFSSCKEKVKKRKGEITNSTPPSCQQTQSCGGQSSPPSEDTDVLKPNPEQPTTNFLVVDSNPKDGENTIHVDDQFVITFNQNIDPSFFGNNFSFSSTKLDIVQMTDESNTFVQITVDATGDKLIIRPNYSLIPSTRYDLKISTELTSNNGLTLDAPFYLTFYTDSEMGIRPGTEIEFSWGRVPNPDGQGGSYYYEEEGYGVAGLGNYNLHYGLKSFPRGMRESQRLYQHTHSFNSDAKTFYTDYDLQRYYYSTELDLLKDRTYYFALDVCSQSYCTEKSDEISIDIP